MRMALKAGLLCVMLLLAACGDGNKSCQWIALNVSPATATANHSAAAPGNQAQFAANGVVSSGCATAQCINCTPGVTWSVSDAVNVSLTPGPMGQSVVIATCLGATSGAATLTATVPVTSGSAQTVSGTATLTCQ